MAADFDGESWIDDARAYLEACRAQDVPAALERSRSGGGGHVWIFFAELIAAAEARRLGAALMTEAMERRPETGFESYDRFFPSQDILPTGGFGDLIALPLTRRPRELGNSVFVNDDLEPYPDQWAFLAKLERVSAARVSSLVREAQQTGRVLGVLMPLDDDEFKQPWLLTPSRRTTRQRIVGPLPQSVEIVLADGVYIARKNLPPALVASLTRTAASASPEFYRAQAMRRSTYDKPRIVSCAELHAEHIALPRGCLDEALALLREALAPDSQYESNRNALSMLGAVSPSAAGMRSDRRAGRRKTTPVCAAVAARGRTLAEGHAGSRSCRDDIGDSTISAEVH